jgi:SAM-dependent methyltransferase
MSTTDGAPAVRDEVRERYAAAALKILQPDADSADGSTECCGPGCGCGAGTGTAHRHSCGCGGAAAAGPGFGAELYSAQERDELPEEAVQASLGCGNPVMVAELKPGETVLDLGSGGGIDVLLSARRVGPTGKAYGLDMTDEMLDLARRNAERAGATNVEFLRGHIEDIPLPAETVDVVISNCVVNLSTDKPAVFASTFRVLKPGGRIGISDVVADDDLTPQQRAERGNWVGCIAGALSFTEYRQGLAAAGFVDIDITPTHEVAPGLHSAIVRARKPVA